MCLDLAEIWVCFASPTHQGRTGGGDLGGGGIVAAVVAGRWWTLRGNLHTA
jgi:hypothetical protein